MCLYSSCCSRMLSCSPHTTTAVARLNPHCSSSTVFHSTSSSFFHSLKRHLHHPLFPSQASQGKILTVSSSIASNQGHTEAARETSAWVLLKSRIFSCAVTLLYPAGSRPPSPSPQGEKEERTPSGQECMGRKRVRKGR